MSENENKMCKPWQHPKNHDKKNYRKHKDRVKQNISYCLRFSPPKFCSGSTPQCHLSILNGGRGIKSGRGIVQNDFNNRIRSEITDIHLGGWEEILSELLSHFLRIFLLAEIATVHTHVTTLQVESTWTEKMFQRGRRAQTNFHYYANTTCLSTDIFELVTFHFCM